MNEVPGGQERARRWWLRKQLWKEEVREALLPPVGTTVGGYHLEARLGTGGQGTVYRAVRGGRLYAVKFLYLPLAGSRARTEVEVLPRLERVGVVRLEGHGKWPDASPLFLFIAMEYVRGRPLYDWARQGNPPARQVAGVLRELTRQLEAVHAEGVVHRDVKGANVVVRPEDGLPVLVDFGVSTWAGAPRRTVGPPPGTWLYRSPEVWRFLGERQPGQHDEARALDDLWALGVVLYRLLTGGYPFDEEDELALRDAVLAHSPEPPHERNPRVPRALGELCLRMLEKSPEARLPTAGALGAALTEALDGADATWDVPLREGGPLEAEPPEEGPTLQPPTPAAPPTSGDAVRAEPPPRWARGPFAGAPLALCVLAVLLAGRAWLAGEPLPAPGPPAVAWHAAPGQEVAPPWKPPEGGGGAAPPVAAIPAPVARATLPEDTRMKTPHTAPPSQDAKPRRTRTRVRDGAAGTCVVLWSVGQLACTGPAAQVRPLTPADCPPEAQEAMRKWGLSGDEVASFPVVGSAGNITVRRGYGASVSLIEKWGKAPYGTVLTGELAFGEERVYGRFTEARTPDGQWFPVCVQLVDRFDDKPGVELRGRPSPETAVVYSTQQVRAVRK